MTQVTLTYYERINVWNLIGNFQAPRLKDVATLLRVIEKVRPTDHEMSETQWTQNDNQIRWQLPCADYGTRNVDLEREEAEGLARVLESVENVRVADSIWMCTLADNLKDETAALAKAA